jgi:ABC-type Fe3+-hydroxamate transport system substrate-binding protein
MTTIARAFAMLMLLALLAACGGAPAAPAPTQAPASAPTSAPALTSAPVAPTSAPASAAFPRTIKHTRGEVTLNQPAQRVVALEWTYVEDLLALGVQPIGVADIEGYNDWVKIPVALDAGAKDVGLRGEPNLETIATLKPDLIIDLADNAANYAELSKIAPVLSFEPYPTDPSLSQYDEMRETLLKIAAAIGRDAEGQAALAHMEAKFATAATQLQQAGQQGAPFILSQAWTGGSGAEVRLFTENAMAVKITEQLGLTNAWQDAAFQQYGFSTVSVEALPKIPADTHFFYVVQSNDDVFQTSAVKPLWDSLPFVKAGRAHALGGDTWLFGGPLSAEVLVDIVVNALSADSTAGSGRVIKHAMGETTVPTNPQRVVVLDSGELDAAVALGVTPVGAFTLFEGDDFLSYLGDKLKGVMPVGTIGEPNLEAIAALKPDLILSNKTRHEAIYDKLSAIAPTVFAASVGAVWKDNFKLYAEALGKQEQGQQVIANYQARLDAFKQRMGDRLATKVSVLRVVEDGVRIIQKKMYIGVILSDAGLARPAAQDVDDRFQLVSFEQIPSMDGDVIFVSYYGKNDAAFKQLLDQPLWKANQAVAAGKVFAVNDDVWQTGLGFVAANLVIDDLERNLAN